MDVEKAVADKENDLLELLGSLLEIDTTNPPGKGYPRTVEVLKPKLDRLGYDSKVVEVPAEIVEKRCSPLVEGPRHNLLASKVNGDREPVTAYAPMDTVPVEEAWSFDPFRGTVRDDKIYGRGAADMKGSIATLVTALSVIEEEDLEPRFDIHAAFVTDEELNYSGACFMTDEDLLRGHVLCLEGGLHSLTVATNGFLEYEVTVRGRSVHSGRSYNGVNALEGTVPILEELLELKSRVEERESGYADPKYGSRGQIRPVLNATMFSSGKKVNIVPSKAQLNGDRRYIPEEDPADVEAEIGEAIARGAGRSKAVDVELDIKRGYPPVATPMDSPRVTRMQSVMEGVLDESVLLTGEQGSSDMGYVQASTRKEVLSFGPGRSCSNPHGADEHVHVEDLLKHCEILVRYLAE